MAQWVGAQGRKKVAKLNHLWRSPRKTPNENEKFFFEFDYKTC